MYSLIYDDKVLSYDIPYLAKSARQLIKNAIEKRLVTDPAHYGKPLRYSLKGHRRIRISNYRVVYSINEEEKTVYIMSIIHRKEGYD